MAKWVTAVRHKQALKPADDEAREVFNSVKLGVPLLVQVKQERSIRQHRMLFKMLRLVHSNLPLDQQGAYPKVENLLDALKIQTGHVRTFTTLSGEVIRVPASISFDEMDQGEFHQFFKSCVDAITEYLIVGLDQQDLMSEVNNLLAERKTDETMPTE